MRSSFHAMSILNPSSSLRQSPFVSAQVRCVMAGVHWCRASTWQQPVIVLVPQPYGAVACRASMHVQMLSNHEQ